MGSSQELEGNRWSVILAETCFVCLEIVLKVFVGFVWVGLFFGFAFWFFFLIQCTKIFRSYVFQ